MGGWDELSDAEVVDGILNGRKELFRVLVRRYEDPLYRHARRMTNGPDEAADIVQRAFVRGYRRLEDCREPDRVGGWLFRITANLCKDHLKSWRREGVSLEDSPPLESRTAEPEKDLARRELSEAIERALERLSPDQREAFVLKHLEGRSYTEMSELLDASESALKMRVHRAREALQELLEPYR